MSLGQRTFVAVFAFYALVTSSGCHRRGGMLATVVTDNISANAGNCVQKVNNTVPSHNKVVVDHNQGKVKWVAPNNMTSCKITFNNNQNECPFYVNGQNYCAYDCTNGTVTSMPATGLQGNSYTYSSMSVNGQCTVGTNGIVLDH